MKKFFIYFFAIIFFTSSCSKDNKKISIVKENIEEEMIHLYREGMKALEEGDATYATRKFDEAEIAFPQSLWASRSSLMSSYALYTMGWYDDAIFNLERHIKKYPKDKNLDYVNYLMAICYYEQIADEKKDLEALDKSKMRFQYIIKNYPNTDFAIDAKYKLELIIELLAAKEMYIGRYYMKTQKWIAAIKRFENVVNNYDQTIFIEEALHRLVEIYYTIGLTEEAEKIAYVLGYNYETSRWYQRSYKLFNQKYKLRINVDKTKKDGFIKRKFKSLFE